MKDSEFIELLNLYVDHEISAADAVRLEAEVQSNPVRRETYQQYCRMQKACKMLASDFEAAPETSRKVVAFEAPRHRDSRLGTFVAFGGFAAAACLAFVFVNRNRHEAPAPATPAIANVAPVRDVAPTPERTGGIHLVSVPPPQQTAANGNSLLLSNQAQPDVLRAAANSNIDPRLQWLANVRFTPIQRISIEDLRLQRSATPGDTRVYEGPRPMDADVEKAAFKFNK